MRTCKNFRDLWEELEQKNLARDRDEKLGLIDREKEFVENEQGRQQDEEDAHVHEIISLREDIETDEQKEMETARDRLLYMAKSLKDEEGIWYQLLMDMKKFKVIKFPRVLQTVFYILGYEREDICEPGTNKFWWKLAKTRINDYFL